MYNNFSGNIKPAPHFRANNWKTFSKIILGRSLHSRYIDPFRKAATVHKVLAPLILSVM